MQVKDVMTAQLVTMHADRSVREGLELAQTRGVDHLLLTDRGRLLGVSCVCELRGLPDERPLRRAFMRPPEVIWPESTLKEAARRFVEKQVGCLPVCDGTELVGVLTIRDLERAGVPAHEIPGGGACVVCGATHHVRPLRHRPGLGVCLQCADAQTLPEEWRAEEDMERARADPSSGGPAH